MSRIMVQWRKRAKSEPELMTNSIKGKGESSFSTPLWSSAERSLVSCFCYKWSYKPLLELSQNFIHGAFDFTDTDCLLKVKQCNNN